MHLSDPNEKPADYVRMFSSGHELSYKQLIRYNLFNLHFNDSNPEYPLHAFYWVWIRKNTFVMRGVVGQN